MGAKKKEEIVEAKISGVDKKVMKVVIKGIDGSTLICNRFSEEKKMQIENKQTKKGQGARPARKPDEEFKASLYRRNGDVVFPSSGLKKACVQAASFADGITKVKARGALFIVGDYLKIGNAKPQMRTDTVRLRDGTTSLAYRGEFDGWEMEASILYNNNVISEDEIRNLIGLAGFHVGIGDWRPEKNGSHGMFELKK